MAQKFLTIGEYYSMMPEEHITIHKWLKELHFVVFEIRVTHILKKQIIQKFRNAYNFATERGKFTGNIEHIINIIKYIWKRKM